MPRWQHYLLWFLLLAPWVAILGLGTYALWRIGWVIWVWVPIAICYGVALMIIQRRGNRFSVFKAPEAQPAEHFTPRDAAAWQVVQEVADQHESLSAEQFVQPQTYFDTALDLANRVSRIYHPDAENPVAHLTVVEILAALELAFAELAEVVDRYVPGGHMLTVGQWQKLAKLPGWYRRFAKWYWPVSAVFAPATVAARYATSKAVLSPVRQSLQDNLLAWFYMTFVLRLGRSIIELNSGRLAGGAARYRAAFGGSPSDAVSPEKFDEGSIRSTNSPQPRHQADVRGRSVETEDSIRNLVIRIALFGQAGAGKTSVIRALLGNSGDHPEDLPETQVTEATASYHFSTDDSTALLIDTVGYDAAGYTERLRKALYQEISAADLILLTLNASQPAIAADLKVLEDLDRWNSAHPETKPPPILVVLTHVDQLRPVHAWQPPYDWDRDQSHKAQNVRASIEYTRETLGKRVEFIVPVSTQSEEDRQFGIDEYLLPAIGKLLGAAKTSALLKALHQDIDRGSAKRVGKQLWEVGKLLFQAGWGHSPRSSDMKK